MSYWKIKGNPLESFVNKDLPKFMDPVFYGLHELYRNCSDPLNLCEKTSELLLRGADINGVDCRGDTPLSLLVLHVNRGLKYHHTRIPELMILEESSALEQRINDVCIKVDTKYQLEVIACMEMLLDHGAIANVIPKSCPSVVHLLEWHELFELKLIQSEQRWNLLSTGTSMEFAVYNKFNPLVQNREENSRQLHVLHFLAWRGDAHCLELLLRHCSIDINQCTVDGWNTLHFLYFYCNKPSDLVAATKLLIDRGVNVNQTDPKGMSPLRLLLRHIFVKRSHLKYLANAYSSDYVGLNRDTDNYCKEIRECVELLLSSGATINFHSCCLHETVIHFIFDSFEQSLVNCEENFQAKGHSLVPYSFQLKPVLEFVQYFLRQPDLCVNALNGRGQTHLYSLAYCLHNLTLDEELNPTEVLVELFQDLLRTGVDPNLQDVSGRAVVTLMVEIATSRPGAAERYLPVLGTLIAFGTDFKRVDTFENSVVHLVIRGNIRNNEKLELLLFLLRCGANPSMSNQISRTPLCELLHKHVFHHAVPGSGIPSTIAMNLDIFLQLMDALCQTMKPESFYRVTSKYFQSGFCGVICHADCPVHQLLWRYHSTPRSLRELCRLRIWQCVQERFFLHCRTDLPLPKKLADYIFELVS